MGNGRAEHHVMRSWDIGASSHVFGIYKLHKCPPSLSVEELKEDIGWVLPRGFKSLGPFDGCHQQWAAWLHFRPSTCLLRSLSGGHRSHWSLHLEGYDEAADTTNRSHGFLKLNSPVGQGPSFFQGTVLFHFHVSESECTHHHPLVTLPAVFLVY